MIDNARVYESPVPLENLDDMKKEINAKKLFLKSVVKFCTISLIFVWRSINRFDISFLN